MLRHRYSIFYIQIACLSHFQVMVPRHTSRRPTAGHQVAGGFRRESLGDFDQAPCFKKNDSRFEIPLLIGNY